MATTQPLKGNSSKIYSVINNFDRGIDKKSADDVATDNSFRELINFYNGDNGSLSKRPGVLNINLTDFIGAIVNGEYSKDGNNRLVFNNNDFGESSTTTIEKLKYIYEELLTNFDYEIIGIQIVEKSTTFFEAMQNYKDILQGKWISSSYSKENATFTCILVFRKRNSTSDTVPLFVLRLHMDIRNKSFQEGNNYQANIFKLEVDYVGDGYYISPKVMKPIDMVTYNGYTYMPTGLDYILKIDEKPEKQADIFQVIGGANNGNLYKPLPQDLTNVGFNLLHTNPMTYYDTSGSVGKIKGVYYAIQENRNGETITYPTGTNIPYNKDFYMYVIFTGDSAVTSVKYRPDNGDTSEETNPYKDVTKTEISASGPCILKISDLNESGKIEIQIKLGSGDEFLTYATVTTVNIPETGLIEEARDLILSSTRMKLINTQLVLYGNHSYLFFSDFEQFNYFPNYYYIYVGNESLDEEIMSINYFRQYYAIFTNRRIKRMTGSFGTSDFGVYPLNDFIGCANAKSVCAVGNALLFVGNDGIYRLKQGYLGEGTENVEKIDDILANEISIDNTMQAFTLNNNYIVANNNNNKWYVYNEDNDAFYEYNIEPETNKEGSISCDSVYKTTLYDNYGDYVVIPSLVEYEQTFVDEEGEEYTDFTYKTNLGMFRYANVDYTDKEKKYQDGYGFISSLETHNLTLGYPTNTKKFKDVYIKLLNKSGHEIPLYVTIYVDDRKVINPEDYEIKYDIKTNTFYYLKTTESNEQLDISRPLGEFTLSEDVLGNRTVQQIKFRVADTGRSIKIVLADGYDEVPNLDSEEVIRHRNIHDFSVQSIGIVYKVKKVKEG